MTMIVAVNAVIQPPVKNPISGLPPGVIVLAAPLRSQKFRLHVPPLLNLNPHLSLREIAAIIKFSERMKVLNLELHLKDVIEERKWENL